MRDYFARVFLMIFISASISASEYILLPKGTFYVNFLEQPIDAVFPQFDIYSLSKSGGRVQVGEYFAEVINPPGLLSTKKYKFSKNREQLSILEAEYGWGSLFDSAKTFKVIDENGEKLGVIDGSFFTSQGAEFTFYDSYSNPFATALLSSDYCSLILKDNYEETIFSCKKSRRRIEYHWHISQNDEIDFDGRFFWPFMAFIADNWWWIESRDKAFIAVPIDRKSD